MGDYYYEKDGTVVIYNKDFAISYSDENDGMASTYSHLMNPIGDGSLLRETYPEESLASCTKEQAVKACEKYARLCGYEDAEVSSYAITLDAIQNIEKKDEVIDTITLFGFTAEEMLEAGAAYEDVMAFGGLVG